MSYSKYHRAIHRVMKHMAKDQRVVFIGQQVGCQDFYGTLEGIAPHQRIEMPVAEEMQTGIAIGLALEGFIPISIYQRMDFLPRAADQIVNHLDKIEKLSRGKFHPKIILRTTIGTKEPMDVGLQHCQDLTEGFKQLVDFPVFKVTTPGEVECSYAHAMCSKMPTLIVEYQELYYE